MESNDFPTRYDPSGEAETYRQWQEDGHFAPADEARSGASFSMVLPPPNVTGTLHVGHAVMLAIEDMMVRYHRMKGDRTLWIPGLDHAAIATQNVVEKKLKKENVQGRRTRHELGREAFLAEVEVFAAQSKARIIEQLRAMGASLDWSRLAYTLDEQRSLAVRTMFTRMYDAGVLYRGNRIVNWCPRCKSTLADDEVNYKEEKTPFYYFTYGPVVIGTARPETKFQDKTLVVHPDDERYTHLLGTTFAVPWIEDEPLTANVIADPVIDRSFGTGAMTITPAHSFEDFALAQQHGLPVVTIINEDGTLTDAAGSFAGRNAREARADIVAILQRKGLVERIDEHYTHNLSVCYRCETPVEPLPKIQWFVDVNKKFRPHPDAHPPASLRLRRAGPSPPLPTGGGGTGRSSPSRGEGELEGVGAGSAHMLSLKDLSLNAVRSGAITIVPERFTKEYFHWMENLRDWCISRQIWFGHRIPAWYRNGELRVGVEAPAGEGWEQDPDTFDTWFSAGMWTFSTLGWPDACADAHPPASLRLRRAGPSPPLPTGGGGTGRSSPSRGEGELEGVGHCAKTGDLAAFHPTSVLETGYDILFFWVARMILMTEFALGEVPFTQVYLHGLVRDSKGRKMSKSLGNVIDPLEMTVKYGADAVRLALFIGTSPGQDTKLDEQKIAGYAKFVTKIWNIARYVAMQLPPQHAGESHARHSEERSDEESHTPHMIEAGEIASGTRNDERRDIADAWIIAKRNELIRAVTKDYEEHEYSKAAQATYDFAWHDFADWYVEASKREVDGARIGGKERILAETLAVILKLLHPAMPFVTEALWKRLGHAGALIVESWPVAAPAPSGAVDGVGAFAFVQDVVAALRQVRSDEGIPMKTVLDVALTPTAEQERAWCASEEVRALIAHLGRAAHVTVADQGGEGTHVVVRSTGVHVRVATA